MILKGLLFFRLDYDLTELDQYLSVAEEYLANASKDFEKKSLEQLKKVPPEEQDQLSEYLAEESWRYSDAFPRLLRRSFVVAAVSVLEYHMRDISNWLKKEKGLQIGWNDLTGDSLERLKKFLRNAAIPVSFDGTTWQELTNVSLVRNCIVHNNGFLKAAFNERQLRTYAQAHNIVSTDTIEEEIAPTKEFCEKVVRALEQFLKELHDAYWASKSAK